MSYRNPFVVACTLFVSTILPGCGWGILGGGGGGGNNDRVTVVGSLTDTSANDIIVLVYNVGSGGGNASGGNGDEGGGCACPGLPCRLSAGDAVVIDSGEDSFSVERIKPGALRIVFLIDNGDDNAQIDEGDFVAVLDDIDCVLDDVDNRRTVTLEDVELDFDEVTEADLDELDERCGDGSDDSTTSTTEDLFCDDDPPAPGRARADDIRISVSNDDDDDDEN
ncbi:MAG TPA: hypothetical protein VEL28_21985 [Candidatus Binatia bacterium]|nr:hypothetical protein [Candidatus Binatia bacterium]